MEHHANVFLTNLAIVLCVAAVTTVGFQRLRQPGVLGYLIAGLLVGPHVPFPLVADSDTIEGLSELGVILLLFGIGLEFTLKKLLRVGVAAAIVAVVEISVQIILGDVRARIFGGTSREALFAGAMMAMSSTTIIAKAFNELRIGGRVRELVLAVLIVEDLVAILLLAAFATLAAGKLSAAQVATTAGRLGLFLAVVGAAGALVIPGLVRANWIPILVLSAVVIAGRMIGVSIPAFLTGAGVRTSIAASMSLSQIGEFSFLIAQLGVSTGAVRDFLYPVAVSVSAVTALTTPWTIRASGPFSAWIDRKLPHALQTFLALYGSWIDGLRAPGPRKTRAQRIVRLLLVDAALGAVVVVLASRFFPDAVIWLRTRAGLGALAAEIAAMAVPIVLSAPFLVGIVRLIGALALALATQALPEGAPGRVDLAAAPRRALIVSLQLVAAVARGLPLFAVARAFLPLRPTLILFAAAFLFLGVRLWLSVAQLQGHVRAGAQVLAAAFSQARGAPAAEDDVERQVAQVLPGLGSPVRFTPS